MKQLRFLLAAVVALVVLMCFFASERSCYEDLICVEEPGSVSSPLVINGVARGPWFFEASFPVILTNWDGLIIAEGYAQAQGDWMTEDFVSFSAELEFDVPEYGETGTLILQKANASGLPEHDDAFELSITF